MEFLLEYGLFLAKTLTLLAAVLLVIGVAVFASHRHQDEEGELKVIKLNERYKQYQTLLEDVILSEEAQKARDKKEKEAQKALKKQQKEGDEKHKKRIFVLDFHGDIRATETDALATEITAILTTAQADDEVVLRLESAGGVVHGYGLAASQLQRIRNHGLQLTVAVDKVAASGGYMMACVGHKVLAAPFAILGSVGVLAQIPNFNRLLKKLDVDFEQLTAGEYKRTLSMFGENTSQGREKFTEELEETHQLFKSFIQENRPSLDIVKISTGEHWFGTHAKELGLVDALITSDDYLLQAAKDADLYCVTYEAKRNFLEKFGINIHHGISRWIADKQFEQG
ncbi:protease SohB [Candidatus Venteria ishoeyi]|uniref:Putative protease SohB n=1 Tax=Candidatus Venteria ishoeyi TaxID=1899563 RepID=A0A1H6FCX9_9GAMM|nr:protease SohB [Candidatus Venteria ishoeyi]MDM8545028.1 protease SohB [Candidatus Venteria ishoeyi]SEH07016.1 putative protease SohB [Candidatus Venteria ishoeyi]